ncbi:hypothetical protein PMAYCL1PPCAC_00175, partial [Pristionchus mayeri]
YRMSGKTAWGRSIIAIRPRSPTMEKRPHPAPISPHRIFVPILFVATLAVWCTWKLTVETPIVKSTVEVPRLQRQDEITCEWPKFSIWDQRERLNSTAVKPIKCRSIRSPLVILDEFGFLILTA